VRPRALDLFCGAGGVTKGLQRAGFHVTGVDLVASPRYCGDAFIHGDTLGVPIDGYDFVWASPPCQRFSIYSRNMGTADQHPDLIDPIRQRLAATGAATCIENVPGAPIRADLLLCGSMFGLAVVRHRRFELNFPAGLALSCAHTGVAIPVFGHGTPQWHRRRFGRNISIEEKQSAMGIDWMNRDELSQAIPPAYSEWIGRRALEHIREAA
jgi:DNA (cytosine-5)-methyltransferase 1